MDIKSLYIVTAMKDVIPAGCLNQDELAVDHMLEPDKRRVVRVRKVVGGRFFERYYQHQSVGKSKMEHRILEGWGPKTLTQRVKKDGP